MGVNRVFVSQATLDRWLDEGHIEVEGETMSLKPEGQRFRIKSAVHFVKEVAGGGDGSGLVHKVKDLEQVEALGGEHVADSVIVGEDAYEVVEGFVGEPFAAGDEDAVASGPTLAAATRAAVGDKDKSASGDIDLLARFFLSSTNRD